MIRVATMTPMWLEKDQIGDWLASKKSAEKTRRKQSKQSVVAASLPVDPKRKAVPAKGKAPASKWQKKSKSCRSQSQRQVATPMPTTAAPFPPPKMNPTLDKTATPIETKAGAQDNKSTIRAGRSKRTKIKRRGRDLKFYHMASQRTYTHTALLSTYSDPGNATNTRAIAQGAFALCLRGYWGREGGLCHSRCVSFESPMTALPRRMFFKLLSAPFKETVFVQR